MCFGCWSTDNGAGISTLKIIDIEWRLDYSIRSKQCGRINIPMYFIKLKVKEGEEIRSIDMIASLEELQDMLAKVLLLYSHCEVFESCCT